MAIDADSATAAGVPAGASRPTRATELRTLADVRATYVRCRSAQVLAAYAVGLTAVRFVIGGWGWGDVAALVGTLVLLGPIEWIIHLFLLHAPDDARVRRALGTGAGHREHHLDPPALEWLLLRGVDAFVFINGFAFVAAAWTVPVSWLLGVSWVGPFVSAWALAAIGLAHYEWVHLLVHTRYRPRNRYYARLARNHRLHHFRNERYWLGVTSNSGDRLFRTYPRNKTDVPLSDTARTLAG